MRRRLFFAVVCLSCLGGLLASFGYIGEFGVDWGRLSNQNGQGMVKSYGASFDDGRFRVMWISTTRPVAGASPSGTYVRPSARLKFNIPMRWTDFDFHSFGPSFSFAASGIVGCPIYLFEFVFLIAPFIWWWRYHRRKPDRPGFPVIEGGKSLNRSG